MTHIHLLVEAERTAALARGMQGLAIRVAGRRKGASGLGSRVLADRYHARLARPLLLGGVLRRLAGRGRRDSPPPPQGGPVWPARLWLLTTGWRRHGLISVGEVPAPPARW